jgi:serine/threonine-protein kinase
VWLARDVNLDIDVALKLLHASVAARSGAKERFASEADLAERMLSPNIVKVLARGFADGDVPYIVYEHLEGEDVGARLSRGLLPFTELRTVIVHTCRAIARAHAVGVLHLDLKPKNLYLTTDTDGRPLVKVLDFGVAEMLAHAKADGDRLVGTLEYAAPEVLLAAQAADVRADLYSVGAVAYECLTAQVPFPGETLGALLLAHASTRFARPSTKRPGVGPELDAWFDRALAHDREQRFASAKEMAESFHLAVKANERPLSSAVERVTQTMRPRMSSFVFEDAPPPSRSEPYAFIAQREDRTSKPPSGGGSRGGGS